MSAMREPVLVKLVSGSVSVMSHRLGVPEGIYLIINILNDYNLTKSVVVKWTF